MTLRRALALVALMAVTATACALTADDLATGAPADRHDPSRGPSALIDPAHPDLPIPLIDTSELRDGGPPPDGIPAIDDPRFVGVDAVDWLADTEPVLALTIEGDARAYPVQIMIWHEIVNDVVGGVPVTVSYCPLCNSAITYDRRVGDEVVDFGTSGRLWRSAMVMYDRQTQSLWSHFDGRAVAGVLTGTQLSSLPTTTVGWAQWRADHPDGRVLSRRTGVERDYGRNPYPGYDDVTTSPFLFDGVVDGRLAAKERIVGIAIGDQALAVATSALSQRKAVTAELAGAPLVVLWAPGTASALQARQVADGDDVGTTGVFDARVDGAVVELTPAADGRFTSLDGTVWGVDGIAVGGPGSGRALRRITHVDTFWFAWAAFHADTALIT